MQLFVLLVEETFHKRQEAVIKFILLNFGTAS